MFWKGGERKRYYSQPCPVEPYLNSKLRGFPTLYFVDRLECFIETNSAEGLALPCLVIDECREWHEESPMFNKTTLNQLLVLLEVACPLICQSARIKVFIGAENHRPGNNVHNL